MEIPSNCNWKRWSKSEVDSRNVTRLPWLDGKNVAIALSAKAGQFVQNNMVGKHLRCKDAVLTGHRSLTRRASISRVIFSIPIEWIMKF
jgi:hypothetical protein